MDDYGFKYEKDNELVVLLYICQQLNIFHDDQSKINQLDRWKWKTRELESNFILTVSLMAFVLGHSN